MKRISTTIIFACISLFGFGITRTIVSSGATFSPDSITVNSTDTIVFSIAGTHNAVEVSLATYNANGTTSNGGFSLGFGGGTLHAASLTLGVHYYVCQAHASMGMKGRIYVINTTGMPMVNDNKTVFSVFPNPSNGKMTVNYSVPMKAPVSIKIIDVTGQNVASLLKETQEMGAYQNSFEVSSLGLSKGIYIMELMVGETRSTQRIMVE